MKHFVLHLKDQFPFLGEDGRDPYVEAYLPSNLLIAGAEDQKRPCLVITPGGGFYGITKRETEPIVLHFLSLGFHIFLLHYSATPHRFPNQLREVAAVLELIQLHQEDWLCDTDHIAILGFSAGGHVAAHYTNAFDLPEVRSVFPNSRGVDACLLCYPVITADPERTHVESFQNLTGKQSLSDEEIAFFSCEKLVTDKTPPTFLWHTAADGRVPVVNSLLYAAALTEHHVPFELHIFPNGRHGLATVESDPAKIIPPEARRNHVWMDLAKSWLQMTFGIE